MKNKLISQGFTPNQASVIMSSVDDIGACIDEKRRSESEYYDGPTDIDHGDAIETEEKKL